MAAHGQVVYQTVALTGQTAPGTGSTFFPPLSGSAIAQASFLNDANQVAFRAAWGSLPTSTSTNVGLFAGAPGALARIASANDPVPNRPAGITLQLDPFASSSFSFYPIDRQGNVFIPVQETIGSAIDQSYFNGSATGGLTEYIGIGDAAPGLAGDSITSNLFVTSMFPDTAPDLSAVPDLSGRIAFRAGLSGPDVVSGVNDFASWVGSPGNYTLIARRGDQVPGMAAGVVNNGSTPRLNEQGRAVILAGLSGTGITSANNSALFLTKPGDSTPWQKLVQTGDAVPGTSAGVSFSGLSVLGSTSAGNVLVLGTVTGTGVTSANSTGIWVDSGGVLSLLARNGDPAPGDTTRTFAFPTSSVSIIHMDAQGDVAFATPVSGALRSGIWAGKPGSLKKIIEDSDTVPGVPAGITWVPGTFRNTANPSGLSLMGFAGDGRGTFIATIQGTGITGANNIGLWSFDPNHGVKLIARDGDTLHVGPGDNRVIANLYTVNSVNNSGVLSFSALFTDGSSGIFLARQQSQGFVANSSFTSQDLSGWAVTGDGSAQAMETTPGSGQFAAQLTTGSPVDLSQSVDVPYSGLLGCNCLASRRIFGGAHFGGR
jgi:hypothetical protein